MKGANTDQDSYICYAEHSAGLHFVNPLRLHNYASNSYLEDFEAQEYVPPTEEELAVEDKARMIANAKSFLKTFCLYLGIISFVMGSPILMGFLFGTGAFVISALVILAFGYAVMGTDWK